MARHEALSAAERKAYIVLVEDMSPQDAVVITRMVGRVMDPVLFARVATKRSGMPLPEPIDINKFFDGLTYPGKRKPALRDQPKQRKGPQPLEEWDDHPRLLKLKGVEVEFFTIRHVALALHRSVRTIRTWERREVIPPALFRSSTPRSRSADQLKDTGDRLWTRAQVEAMVRVAKEEKVLDGLPPGPRFTAKLVRAFLAQQEHPNRNT